MADFLDMEVALLLSLYVVLIQVLAACGLTYASEDGIFGGSTQGGSLLDSDNSALTISTLALYDYRLCTGLICFEDNLRYWVKPRSTTWFSQFLMSIYDDSRWIEFFRMDKGSVADMCYRMRRQIEKQDTHYRLAVPVEVRVCAALYKLAQGANFLSCSEKFAIGKSTVSVVIREVVAALNICFGNLIRWPRGEEMRQVMLDFKSWCGMPSVQGAIDGTHIAISKPAQFPEDYWYFKTGAYSMVAQAVVDSRKQFTSVFVGLPRSVNDQRVLRRSGLWQQVVNECLLHVDSGYQDGIPPYLLADKGYPLLSWMMTPFKDDGGLRSLAKTYYNKHHRRGRSVIENAFRLLKENWREISGKTELHVTIVPDVFYACCILHNLTIQRGTVDFEQLMRRMTLELQEEVCFQNSAWLQGHCQASSLLYKNTFMTG
jgi:hypothetical protein